MYWSVGTTCFGSMAVSVDIKNVRDASKRYVFTAAQRKEPDTETDARLLRLVEEIAKHLAHKVADHD